MIIRRPDGLIEEELTRTIIGAFYMVHRQLGFGFLEHVYSTALEIELRKRGLEVAREFGVTVYYDGIPIAHHRLDMVIEGRVAVENKSTERLPPHTERQLFNYLHATRLEVGLVLHYGPSAKFRRVICATSSKPPRQRPPDDTGQPTH